MSNTKVANRLVVMSCLIVMLALCFDVRDARAENFIRKQFQYEAMGVKPAKDCTESQNEMLDIALSSIDRNQSKQAVKSAEKVFADAAKCPRAHGVYAWSLFRSGEWLQAVEMIDSAIETFGSDPALISLRASMGLEMAELGLTRKAIDGNTTYYPRKNGLTFDEAQFKDENYRTALDDFIYLAKVNSDGHEESYTIAYLYFILGEYEKSNSYLEKLLAVDEYRNNALMSMTNNHIATKQYANAEKILLDMEADYPKSPDIQQLMVKLYSAMGDKNKAAEHKRKQNFYGVVPPFAKLDYTKENYELIASFASRKKQPKEKYALLDNLVKTRSSEFLADICLTILAMHQNHDNELEERATKELVRIGKESIPKVIELLGSETVSTCTLTNAADILATTRDERGWQPLVDSLPRIAGLPSTLIPPAIPEKLLQFDRERAVSVLLPFIRDMIRADQGGDGSGDSGDLDKTMIYYSFINPFASFDKAELLKLAKEHGYTEKEQQILVKYATRDR